MELGTRTLLLLALSEGPAFGLELIARVEARSEGRFHLNRGGTYVALKKLEAEGLVRAWIRATGSSGRPRRYCELTPRGIAELEATRLDLAYLVAPTKSSINGMEARRMVERVQRCGDVSALARDLRDASARAGLR
jgi:PadR family transcriptional regulator PadR